MGNFGKMVEVSKNAELKIERFKKVGANRTNKVLNALDNLSKCSTSKNYIYTKEQVNKMIKVIQERLDEVKGMYLSELEYSKEPKFKF